MYNADGRTMLFCGVLLGAIGFYAALEYLELRSRLDALELRTSGIDYIEGLYKRVAALEDSATVKIDAEEA